MRIYTRENFPKLFDHTGLAHDKNKEYLDNLCLEAKKYNFKMVTIHSIQTAYCADHLNGTEIGVGAAVSFPLGQTTIETKLFETLEAIHYGATEIDYVINITEVKNKNWFYVTEEMRTLVTACRKRNVISKVIFENALLEHEEIIQLAKIAKEVRPDFIKTSTGYSISGAKAEDVRLMKEYVGDQVKVKAAGGIQTFETVLEMLSAGAERIGTSRTVQIMKEFELYLQKNKLDEIIIQ